MTALQVTATTARLLEVEAEALLVRLGQVRPFVLTETMVVAANLPYQAHRAIERFLFDGRMALRREVVGFLGWLHGAGRGAPPEEQQRRFVVIRLRFNDVLSQLDMFAEVLTQRSEQTTGVWLSGLDHLAADALRMPAPHPQLPPQICYLARGSGAAIRRARTRLPGGRLSPVAIIRVPRERMVGHGVASSLVHEVGHQAAALLGLVESLRAEIRARGDGGAWETWHRTVSECVADFWAVGKLGISATLGLMAVVSLPRYFVFRPSGEDPHPTPYLRVLLSAAVGDVLYPHPQWRRMAETWRAFYPTGGLPADHARAVAELEPTVPAMARLLAGHRPPSLGGRALAEIMPLRRRRPEQLLAMHAAWRDDLGIVARLPPTLVFAAVGQARAAGRVSADQESDVLSSVLTAWAVRGSLEVLERDARVPSAVGTRAAQLERKLP
ncbi:hypothetical protein [Georgenia sp. SYP-B2076]|uniref:hypothetical protein n=1 Tax=Georgenia sp. SYP-B2076 TaxID=2495881 RepID=UPI000F8F10AC|nr:hypothetical protein [Georgenia sp. SYP-B2076]